MLTAMLGQDDVEEYTNKKLSKLFSVEMLLSLLSTAALVGVMWGSLSEDVSSNDTKLMTVEQKQDDLEGSVQSIQVDVAIVKTNQEHLKRDIEDQNRKLREQGQDIKEILRIIKEDE